MLPFDASSHTWLASKRAPGWVRMSPPWFTTTSMPEGISITPARVTSVYVLLWMLTVGVSTSVT